MVTSKEILAFLDADTVISSLLSNKGASWMLINRSNQFTPCLTDKSVLEINKVIHRLGLPIARFLLLRPRLAITKTTLSFDQLVEDCVEYVNDRNDAMILAGALLTKSRFLLTFNLKHYSVEKIKSGLGIVTMTPGSFLQYLRSLS